jgi:hypothetical protein
MKNFFFCSYNTIFSLAAKIALIHFETPKIPKMAALRLQRLARDQNDIGFLQVGESHL